MQMSNNSSNVPAVNASNVKLPPISNGVSDGTTNNVGNNQNGDGQITSVKRAHASAKSQQLIYRSIPPKVQNFTLSDMLDAGVTPNMKSKKPKGSSLTSSSEFAKRFMSRPMTQPKVIDFNVGNVKTEKRRRAINGFFPPVKLRVSARKDNQKGLLSPEVSEQLYWRLPKYFTLNDFARGTNIINTYNPGNKRLPATDKHFDKNTLYFLDIPNTCVVDTESTNKENLQNKQTSKSVRRSSSKNNSSKCLSSQADDINISYAFNGGCEAPGDKQLIRTDLTTRNGDGADNLNEKRLALKPNANVVPTDETTFSILQNRWKLVHSGSTRTYSSYTEKRFNNIEEQDIFVGDVCSEDNIRKKIQTKSYMVKGKRKGKLSIENLRRFSSSLNLRQPERTKLPRFSSSEYLNRSQSDLDDRFTSKSAISNFTTLSVSLKAADSDRIDRIKTNFVSEPELSLDTDNNGRRLSNAKLDTVDSDVTTRESQTVAKIRNGMYPTQVPPARLQLVPTSYSEVRPRSSKSRSISRASRNSVLSRKTPDSIRTAPPGPETLAIYPETFECDDLSYLPPPKRILPKRDVPWVFRYKVKRNMNELSKILASKPSQMIDV